MFRSGVTGRQEWTVEKWEKNKSHVYKNNKKAKSGKEVRVRMEKNRLTYC
jgi:hypothetical protein